MTSISPTMRLFVIQWLTPNIFYMCAKFDDSSIGHYRDMFAVTEIKRSSTTTEGPCIAF